MNGNGKIEGLLERIAATLDRVQEDTTRMYEEQTRMREEQTRMREEQMRMREEQTRMREEQTRMREEQTRTREEQVRMREDTHEALVDLAVRQERSLARVRDDMNHGFAQVNARIAIAGRHHDTHEQRIQVLEEAVLGKCSG